MAEGEKRAHSDLNINIEGPREELDIVTERPRDLSPAMDLEMNRNKSLVDALGHLGNIADNANDLNRTINAYDWDVDYKDRADEMKIEQRRMEETAQLNLFNDVSATKVQMMKDVENAKEAARNSGDGNVLAAAQGAMDGYRDAFSDSLEGSKMWSNVFNSTYEHETQYGILSDFEIAQAKAIHNINQSQNEIFKNVTMGVLEVDSGMKKLLVDTLAMKGHLPNQKYVEMMDNSYNQLVIAKALNLSKVANGSNAIEVANAIRDLINKYGKKEYACFDGQGKPLTDEHGNPVTYTASLTPATVEELLRTAQSYENKVSSAGTGGATKTFEEYKEFVGGKDLEKTGVSDYFTYSTSISAKHDYDELMSNIQNNPNLTTKQKIAQMTKVSDYYFTVVQPSVATYEAMQLTPDSRLNHKKLQQKLAELDAALASGRDMTNYSLHFDLAGGGTYELKAPNQYAMINSADPQQSAFNSWRTIRDTISRTLNAETNADFMYGTNANYTTAVNRSKSLMGRNSLVTTNGEKSWINQQGMAELGKMLTATRQAHIDAAGTTGKYAAVPSTILDTYVDQYRNCINPKQQNDYTRAFATALTKAGYSSLLMSNEAMQSKSNNDKQAFSELQKEMYLQAPNLSGIRAIVTQSSLQGNGYYTTEAAKQYLDEKGLKGGDLVNYMSNLLRDNAIPPQYQESLMSAMANVAVAYATAQQSDKSISKDSLSNMYKGDLKNALELIVKNNFVSLSSPYIKTKVHIGNPALTQGRPLEMSQQQAKNIGRLVTNIGDNMHSTLNRIGIKTYKDNIRADFDAVSGRITFKVNNETLGLSNENTGSFGSFVSVPYNYMAAKPKNFTDYQWQNEVADYVSASATLAFVSKDYNVPNKKFYTDPVTKTSVNSKQASADAIRMLSVLQRDDFLTNYSNTMTSGGKIGVSSAPRYLKEAFKRDTYEVQTKSSPYIGITEVTAKVQRVPESISRMLDFAYSKSVTHNKVDITVNKPLSYNMQGLNFTGVMTAAHNNGFRITRDYDNKQYGNYVSKHSKGMALDFGINANNMEDRLTGRVKVSAMENFTNMLTKNPAYAKKVNCVLTSRPELLENKPEYAAYAKFRALKNSQGKPLFRDARAIDKTLPKGNNHANHFHVDFREQVVDSKGKDFVTAYNAVAEDMVNTSAKSNTPVNNTVAKALLTTFGDRFGQQPNRIGQFGMANLTESEYSMLGVPKNLLQDPTIQARVTANRYQAYSNVLGSTDLAVYALAGAKFRNQDNKVMTIQEIINSGKISGIGGQRYYLAEPMKNGKLDAAEQARQNALYRKYKKALKN